MFLITLGQFNASDTDNRYIGQSADEVVKVFVDNVILIYGIPQVILSDCGSQFLRELLTIFANYWELRGSKPPVGALNQLVLTSEQE
jgi:hypothetical protein